MILKKLTLIKKIILASLVLAFSSAIADTDTDTDPYTDTVDRPIDMPDYNQVESLGTMALSLSSDAHYAISSNLANQVILWDLQKQTHTIISNHANIYSAYYIKNSPYFMWQELPKDQLKLGTSTGAPPRESLALVEQNTLGIVSRENEKNYAYFYVDKGGNFQDHIDKKEIPDTLFNHFFIRALPFDELHANAYEPQYKLDTKLSNQMHFIQMLITLGYDSGNIVHVQDPSGKEILHFDNFPVYGQVMRANLKDYFASTFNWDVFQGYGKNQKLIMYDNGGFYQGKLLNLTLSDTKPFLLTSGVSPSAIPIKTSGETVLSNMRLTIFHNFGWSNTEGVILWSTQTGKPIHAFNADLVYNTYATLSPDGNYVLAADEDARNHAWSTQTYEHLFKLWDLQRGKIVGQTKDHNQYIFSKKGLGLIEPPKWLDDTNGELEFIYSYKFIDQNHYLRITMSQPYAILYKVDSPKPLKYFYLGKDPLPALNDFAQDTAIDSSPSKHILVIAMHADASGILEYQYNPKTMTLKRIWVGDFPATEAEAALAAYKQKTNPTPPAPTPPTEKLETQKPWYKNLW